MCVNLKKISASYTQPKLNPHITSVFSSGRHRCTQQLLVTCDLDLENQDLWGGGESLTSVQNVYLTQISSSYSCLHMLTSATPATITWMIIPTSCLFFFLFACCYGDCVLGSDHCQEHGWPTTTTTTTTASSNTVPEHNTMQTLTEGLKLLLLLLLVHSPCGCCVSRWQL